MKVKAGRWLALAAICLLSLVPAAGVGATGEREADPAATITLAEYERALQLVLARLETAQQARPETRVTYLAEAVRLLESVGSVTLPSGDRITVDNRWLVDELRSKDPALDAAVFRLRKLIEEVHGLRVARPRVWREDPEAALRRVLAQKQYGWDRPTGENDPLAKAFTAIRERLVEQWHRLQAETGRFFKPLIDWLNGVLGNSTPSDPSAPGFAWPIYALGFAVIVGFAILLIWAIRRHSAPGVSLRRRREAEEEVTTMAKAVDAANQLSRKGDYRGAIRALYLAALLHLHEKQLIQYDRTLTNREHLRAVRHNATLYSLLAPLVMTFDRVWYGHRAPTAEDYEAYQKGVDGLRKAVS